MERTSSLDEITDIFNKNMEVQRNFEREVTKMSNEEFNNNRIEIDKCVKQIVKQMEEQNEFK